MGIFGIDVSHHQGLIDWEKVGKQSDVRFVIIKCQYEGKTHKKDEYFERNYNGTGINGIKRGVYDYIGQSSITDIESAANMLIKNIGGRNLECGVWLDVEDKFLQTLKKDELEKKIIQYANIIESAGYRVGIYCNMFFYRNVLTEKIKNYYPVWIARYPVIDTGSFSLNSILKPDESLFLMWQYSSKGKIPGINGHVDLNYNFHENLESYMILNPYPEPDELLYISKKGNMVRWLQYELILNHYKPGVIDGIFGWKTFDALKSFQEDHHLTGDGICGSKTISKIKELQRNRQSRINF